MAGPQGMGSDNEDPETRRHCPLALLNVIFVFVRTCGRKGCVVSPHLGASCRRIGCPTLSLGPGNAAPRGTQCVCIDEIRASVGCDFFSNPCTWIQAGRSHHVIFDAGCLGQTSSCIRGASAWDLRKQSCRPLRLRVMAMSHREASRLACRLPRDAAVLPVILPTSTMTRIPLPGGALGLLLFLQVLTMQATQRTFGFP